MKSAKKLFCCLAIGLGLLAFAEERDASYEFIVLGDLHYTPAESYSAFADHPQRKKYLSYIRMWEHDAPDLLRAAGRTALARDAKFAVQLGDLANADCPSVSLFEQSFRRVFSILKDTFPKIPLYIVIGNHEVSRLKGAGAGPARKVLLPLMGKALGKEELSGGNYSFRRGKDLFIAIDCFIGEEPCQDFIRRVLDENPDTRYVFLLTHHPLFLACGQTRMALVSGYSRIIPMLEKRRTIILAAHTHEFSWTTLTARNGRLPQLVVTSLGKFWQNSHWRRKIFGTRLGVEDSWNSFLPKMKKKLSGKRDGAALLKELDGLLAMGSFDGKVYVERSGFVVLRVSDRQVQADIYVDDSGKPGATLDLL